MKMKKEKIEAQNSAEEIKINAERAILNIKNEISKTQALIKENKTHSNISIEHKYYKGSSEQNFHLLYLLMSGKLIKPKN